MNDTKNIQKGFTLVELMIVLAIVAILATIAIPSYKTHVIKSRRAEAHAALMNIYLLEAEYFQDNDSGTLTYTTTLSELDPDFGTTTTNGHYDLTVAAGADGITSGFMATATAVGIQSTDDTDCPTVTINQDGTKGPITSCW